VKFGFIDAEKANYPVALMCRFLAVSRAGYYEWKGREPTARGREDEVLKVKIAAIHKRSRGTYGSPRIQVELGEEGHRVGRKRVARLMTEQGLSGCRPRPYKVTTNSDHTDPVAANLVDRDFAPAGPDQVWAGDITYIRTWQGWLYLAVVIDLWSRRVVGWSIADHMRTELVLNALDMAVGQRCPEGVVHHSDRGSQYTSKAQRAALKQHGMVASMSRKGDCWDNAVVESFFATLKTELVYRRPWPCQKEARTAIHDYIGWFYNGSRRHSFLGNQSPVEYERMFNDDAAVAA